MKKRYAYISTAILCYLIWIIFVTPFASGMTMEQMVQELLVGIVVALLVATFCYRFFIKENPFWFFNPKRWVYIIPFILVFLKELLKTNIDVAIRALSPRVKTNSGIVKIKTELKSDYGLSLLANCITLTPGTITIDIERGKNENYMYIHWIDVKSKEINEASKDIKGVFEKRIRRFLK